MFCTGRFYVDEKDYPILKCHLQIPQKSVSKSGMVLNDSSVPQIHLTLESTSDTHLLSWINDQQIKDNVQVRIVNYHRLGADKVFDLRDVRCVQNDEYFWGLDNRPMTNVITLVAAIFQYNGSEPIIQHWHIQDPNDSDVTATERPVEAVDEDENFIEAYILDENNQRITVIDKPQLITVVIKTQGKVRKKIKSISLYNEEYDYVYEGTVLKNDTLRDYVIQTNEDHLSMKVIEATNQNN